MKGLLLKDWYTLIKQMKIMLVLMLAAVLVLPLILSPVSARIAQSRAESAGGSNR